MGTESSIYVMQAQVSRLKKKSTDKPTASLVRLIESTDEDRRSCRPASVERQTKKKVAKEARLKKMGTMSLI